MTYFSYKNILCLIGSFATVFVVTMMMPTLSLASTEQQQLIDKAKLTAQAFAADPQQAEIREWVKSSKGVFIVPQLLRGAFVFGGTGGGGILLVRDEKSGEWSQPAFYNIGAVSFGLQAGADASELIFVVRTQKGLEEFYRSDFKLGGEVGVALGPIGNSNSMEGMAADLISFGRTKGAFMGMALKGAMITVSDDSNSIYYGKNVRPTDILVRKSVSNPESADLRDTVAAWTKEK